MSDNDLILASLSSIHAKLDSLRDLLEQLMVARGFGILVKDVEVSDCPGPPRYREVQDGTAGQYDE